MRHAPSLTPRQIVTLYALLASLWIVGSSLLVSQWISDPAWLSHIEYSKGLVFVGITSILLYILLRLQDQPPEQPSPMAGRRFKLQPWLLVILTIMTLMGPTLSYFVLKINGPANIAEAQDNLAAIARLQATHINSWLEERRGDASALRDNRPLAFQLSEYLAGRDTELRLERASSMLNSVQQAYRYRRVTAYDTEGNIIAPASSNREPANQYVKSLLQEARTSDDIQVGDLIINADGKAHFYLIAPIKEPYTAERTLIAFVLLSVEPQDFLIPLLKQWPSRSTSGEILLLQHQTTHWLVFPWSRRGTPDAHPLQLSADLRKQLLNNPREQTWQGLDSQGIPVLAAFHPIPQARWLLITKQNLNEVMAPLHQLAFWVLMVSLVGVGTLLIALCVVWIQQRSLQRLALDAANAKADTLEKQFYQMPFIGMAMTSPSSKFWLRFNDRLCEILGYPRQELSHIAWTEITHPDDVKADVAFFEAVMRGESDGYAMDKRFIRKDGTIVYATIDVKAVRAPSGEVDYFVATVQDISERKRTEQLLRDYTSRLEQAEQHAQLGSWEFDLIDNQGWWSKNMYRLLRFQVSETAPSFEDFLRHVHPEDEANLQHALELIAAGAAPDHLEYRSHPDLGDIRSFSATAHAITDAKGTVIKVAGTLLDITAQKEAEAHIEQLAYFDVLTQLPNRTLLQDRVNTALHLARRNHSPLALMYLDLDHFKHVNDTLGHPIGDKLLVAAAQRLRQVLRDEDTLARTGGDEFVLILPETNTEGAAHVAQKLIELMTEDFDIEPYHLSLTLSIGIAMYPSDAREYSDLYRCADVAMFRAKADGRNSFRFFTTEMQIKSMRTLTLENALRHALERQEMQVFYQPQICLHNRQVIGAEALLRWQHPELGWVSPAEFIPIAEDTGQILAIGDWVLETACKQLQTWRSQGAADWIMAVNMSAVQFRQSSFSERVGDILKQTQLPSHLLELELTESVAMDDPTSAIEAMKSLNQQLIKLSIDDFGTGYSSLSYLKRLPIYKLKIDQSFVRDVSTDSDDEALVNAIIRMAHSLGLKTIAEGVETEAQLAILTQYHCDEAQGYLFSKPVPAEQFWAYCQQHPHATPLPETGK